MPPPRVRSLKSLLLTHELAFLLLVTVTGALGGLWAYFWQKNAGESLRINNLLYEAQQARGDVYRQIRVGTLGRIMEDPGALGQYTAYSRKIDRDFNRMREHSASHSEDLAIQGMQVAYRVIQKDLNNIFTNPYAINRMAQIKLLIPQYEQKMIGDFESSFSSLASLLESEHSALNNNMEYWTHVAPVLIPIPIVLALGLLLFSRRSLQRGFVHPTASLKEGALRFSHGQLNESIPVHGAAEMCELAEAINHMAEELARNRDALVESERQAALGALVPVVAHNIRNPLASIRASAQMLDHVDSPEDQLETKQAIIETVDRLGRWVNALVSYLHPLKPHPVQHGIVAMVEAALKLLQPRLEEKGIAIEREGWDRDRKVEVDADLMEQALYGLLSNATDATPPGGQISVALREEAGEMRLLLKDQGPGMPFEPKPDNLTPGPSTKRLGTGLGIPVAFKVCNAHGWKLDFSNPPEGGTMVSIGIPLAKR